MITEWLLGLGAGMAEWFATLIPPLDLPAEITDGSAFDTVAGIFAGMGVWVEWSVLILVSGAVLASWISGYAARAIRAIAAHVPFLGGAGD